MRKVRQFITALRWNTYYEYMVIFNAKALEYVSQLTADLVRREGEMADLTASDVGLVVMSGPLPYTSLFLNQVFKTKLFIIDREISICFFAKLFLNRNYPGVDLTILRTTANRFKENITFAMLPLIARPKMELISKLFTRYSQKSFRVIVRAPKGEHKKTFSDIDRNYLKKKYLLEEISHYPACPFTTICIKNK